MTCPRSKSAPATTTSAADVTIIFVGINCMAPATSRRATAMAANPRPSSSQDIPAKLPTALAMIFREAASISRPAPEDRPTLPSSANLESNPSAVSAAATPAKPRPSSSQLIPEKACTALAKILMAIARAINPRPVEIILALLDGIRRAASATSPRRTPTPVNPFSSSSQLREDKALTDAVSNKMAIDSRIIDAVITGIFAKPELCAIFSNMAIEASSCPNIAVIAVNALASAAESISDKATIDRASRPMAAAILSSAPARSCVCMASSAPVTPPSASLMESIIPPLGLMLMPSLRKLRIAKAMTANRPVLSVSRTAL